VVVLLVGGVCTAWLCAASAGRRSALGGRAPSSGLTRIGGPQTLAQVDEPTRINPGDVKVCHARLWRADMPVRSRLMAASSVGTGASRDATRKRHNLRSMPCQNNKGRVYERCRERHAYVNE
jgi:hypothetical protein